MFPKYIILLAALFLLPGSVLAGDLESVARAFENMAEASRSADRAQDAFQDAIRTNPRYRDRDYYPDRRYWHYNDAGHDYGRHDRRAWRLEKDRARAMRKADKKWRKEYEKEMKKAWKRRHHHDD